MVSEGVREYDNKKDLLSKLIGGYAKDLVNANGA
jgi:hypothetical protein